MCVIVSWFGWPACAGRSCCGGDQPVVISTVFFVTKAIYFLLFCVWMKSFSIGALTYEYVLVFKFWQSVAAQLPDDDDDDEL